MSLLESLIIVSEKAANIARICRQEQHLFELLVEEKGNAESNPRFIQDFKTLADVLIQETVKHDVGQQFPALKDYIKGEESNTFCNKLGETICVEIQNDVNETAKLLEIVLNGDTRAGKLLAEEVHKNVLLEDVDACNDKIPKDAEFNSTELGIWIDPIDSTAEYISGREMIGENGIFVNGLRCVTVLIGAYDRKTGIPIMGVVNQPFFEQNNQEWRGHCHWGYTTPEISASSRNFRNSSSSSNIVCLSSSEDEGIKNKLRAKGFTLVEAAGAGYKILTVITGHADAYVLSKDTTFKWDTCGPQAILKSLGGDVLKFDEATRNSYKGLEYKDDFGDESNENKIVKYCNTGGIIAYREEKTCIEIVNALN